LNNKKISKLLKNTVALMELHDENEFKIKSYNNALFNLDRYEGALADQSKSDLEKISGVGKSIAEAINQINEQGTFDYYESLYKKTPEGLHELLGLKGIGAKKIRQLWNELGITCSAELLTAIDNGKIKELKGFGGKTQENIKAALLRKKENEGKLLFADAEHLADKIIDQLQALNDNILISASGTLRRKLEVIEDLTFVVGSDDLANVVWQSPSPDNNLVNLDQLESVVFDIKKSGPRLKRGMLGKTPISFHLCSKSDFIKTLFLTTGSAEHINHEIEGESLKSSVYNLQVNDEKEIYEKAGLPFIPVELREPTLDWKKIKDNGVPKLIEMDDLKGILHNHSTYSDGQHTLEDMALECIRLGYEYLGISDHSKSSFYYANGLYENRVIEQQKEIDLLNQKLAPFKIFKGIECDILPDGSLDYDTKTLASFDFIVSSIHSAMSMDQNKATDRLIKAIENPFTTILGHMTGRILLQRDGYPVDHKAVIDACAKHDVVIEINANRKRLDIDWRWVNYALDKGVMLSINPDAHAKEGYADMYYGLQIGRKGGLTKAMNLNSMTLNEIDDYFTARKAKAISLAN
jgi:DNA polymerase (family X)